MPPMCALVGGRRPGSHSSWPAGSQKRPSVGPARWDNATGPPPTDPRAGTTRKVSPIALSRGRRSPVGTLEQLTQGGVPLRTHAWEQRTPDERARGERACGGMPGPVRAKRKGGARRTRAGKLVEVPPCVAWRGAVHPRKHARPHNACSLDGPRCAD